jgi:hypothetical protein
MIFDKDKYWANRNNTVKTKDADDNEIEVAKPLRGQGVKTPVSSGVKPSTSATLGFSNEGQVITINRFFRRQKERLFQKSSQLRKKNKGKKKK